MADAAVVVPDDVSPEAVRVVDVTTGQARGGAQEKVLVTELTER